jgi:hypothetical protein
MSDYDLGLKEEMRPDQEHVTPKVCSCTNVKGRTLCYICDAKYNDAYYVGDTDDGNYQMDGRSLIVDENELGRICHKCYDLWRERKGIFPFPLPPTEAQLDKITKLTSGTLKMGRLVPIGQNVRQVFLAFRLLAKDRLEATPPLLFSEEEDYLTQAGLAPHKLKRRLKALEENANCANTLEEVAKVKMMPKGDECTRAHITSSGELTAKTRAIFFVDPKVDAKLYRHLHLYSNVMKHLFDEPFHVKDKSGKNWCIHLKASSTKTVEQIGDIARHFEASAAHTIYIANAGDDLCYFVKAICNMLGIELDVDGCDNSVSFHLTQEYLKILDMIGLGWLAAFLQEFYAKYQLYFDLRSKDGRTKYYQVLTRVWKTLSGERSTTTKNSFIVSVNALVSAINHVRTHRTEEIIPTFTSAVKSDFNKIGMSVSGDEFKDEEMWSVSFLRGWWPRDQFTGLRVFQSLPSAIANYGKTRKNYIHGTPGKDNLQRSARYAAHGTARSNAHIARNEPIIGRYLAFCDRVSIKNVPMKMDMFQHRTVQEGLAMKDWSIESDIHLDLEDYEKMLSVRYDISIEDTQPLSDFHDAINLKNFKPFTRFGSPLITKLLERDYGKVLQKE